MSIVVTDLPQSHKQSLGVSPWVERQYTITGTDDHMAACTALQTYAPAYVDPWGTGLLWLMQDEPNVEEIGDELWRGTVRWGLKSLTYDAEESFETGGGTQHVNVSKQTLGWGVSPPPTYNMVGATKDGIAGVDIVVPQYQWTEKHYLSKSIVTPSYKALLARITGRTNNAAF